MISEFLIIILPSCMSIGSYSDLSYMQSISSGDIGNRNIFLCVSTKLCSRYGGLFRTLQQVVIGWSEEINLTHDLPEWEDPEGNAIPIQVEDILNSTQKTDIEKKVILSELAEKYEFERNKQSRLRSTG